MYIPEFTKKENERERVRKALLGLRKIKEHPGTRFDEMGTDDMGTWERLRTPQEIATDVLKELGEA